MADSKNFGDQELPQDPWMMILKTRFGDYWACLPLVELQGIYCNHTTSRYEPPRGAWLEQSIVEEVKRKRRKKKDQS